MGIDFCHLAGGASFDILRDEVFHVGPPEVLAAKLDGFCDSGVSGCR